MNEEEIKILLQYINALNEAVSQLEIMNSRKNLEEIKKLKLFIMEIHEKISNFLKGEII
ncbi:MAG: hypothetical protein QXH60_02495 [Candidatus Pacearchaeota archaeon]